jgi:hypothetical protein
MIKVVPFEPHHLSAVKAQPAQVSDQLTSGDLLAVQDHSWSFVDASGEIVACFGLIKSHAQHYTAWALLSCLPLSALIFATRWCRAYLKMTDVRRIDCTVRADFANGHQWAGLLGFEEEGVQSCFFEDGADMVVYAMIRKDVP